MSMASTTHTSAITATSTPKVNEGNLANGLFSDFAPLLQLFGDEVTKQFLATSMGLGDDILLSIAPIGIITIVVCAIRIRGYAWMKAMIGRARDSPDDEEKDILPSTSSNVREIWNGYRVIRQSGESQTTEFVYYNRHIPWQLREGPQSLDRDISHQQQLEQLQQLQQWQSRMEKHCGGIWTLEEALRNNPLRNPPEPIYRIQKKNRRFPLFKRVDSALVTQPSGQSGLDAEKGHDKSCEELADLVQKKSPNLTLNIPAAIPSPVTVWIFASIGLVLQAIVLVYNALVVYHYRWLRGGYIIESYGYPFWASGTLCISIGVCLCAWIVDSSTREFNAEPIQPQGGYYDTRRNSSNTSIGFPFRVVRLQKPIPSLNLPAFALFNKETDPQVVISSRILSDSNPRNDLHGVASREAQAHITSEKKSKFMPIATAFGALITITGFILQNIGTRELHWSAGVAQLLSTLVLVVIRALVRRHVGEAPDRFQPLEPGYEATQMAMIINKVEQLEIRTGTSGLRKESVTSQAKSLSLDRNSITVPASQPTGTPPLLPKLLSKTLTVSDSFGASDGTFSEPLVQALEASRKQFLKILPCKTEVHDMAVRVLKACNLILQALEIDNARWLHPISIRISPSLNTKAGTTEQVQGVEFFNLFVRSPKATKVSGKDVEDGAEEDAEEDAEERIESLLDSSMWSYSKSKLGVFEANAPNVFLRILGFCPPDQEDSINMGSNQKEKSQYRKKFKYFQGWSSSIRRPEVYQLTRQSNGQAQPDREFWSSGRHDEYGKIHTETVFCMEYSAIGYDDKGVEHTRNGEMIEFFTLIRSLNGLLGAFAYDIMATFLLAIVRENKSELEAKLKSSKSRCYVGGHYHKLSSNLWENDLFKEITSILIEQGVIHKGEADRMVLAAFLASDLFPSLKLD